jgi:hypothetical protein
MFMLHDSQAVFKTCIVVAMVSGFVLQGAHANASTDPTKRNNASALFQQLERLVARLWYRRPLI